MFAEFLLYAVLIGIGATALFDLWSWLLKVAVGIPLPNWAMTGRWFAHLPRGRVMHREGIGKSPRVEGELAIGWLMHYVTGIVFAAALLLVWGVAWARLPTLGPALAVGWITIACGWFILQPALGLGVAASRTPNPAKARVLNILGHTVFGLGLYETALLVNVLRVGA
ncbi:Permeases of the major facilitator superfamily [plant metagenome]|uniref:Permeases of the major facilitator superfamily n=1 Tax=plant metagenome TaxID=1297885 RepID=A0A484PP98_9ZZZZ